MPIYEYECQTCGEEFEVIQKFDDPPLKRHDCAPKSVVRRMISLNAFQLKGGGWYTEGYGKGNSGNGDSAKSGGNGDGKAAESGSKKGSDSAKSDSGSKASSGGKDSAKASSSAGGSAAGS